MEQWNGFALERFIFEDHEALVVFPNGNANGRLALKTEYWDAFPATEIELAKKGFHLCYIKNNHRWGAWDDLDRKARFVEFVAEKYGLSPRCVPVGMSCGGLFGIKFAAKYPQLVACLYLDAPVLNYMSCPCHFGAADSPPPPCRKFWMPCSWMFPTCWLTAICPWTTCPAWWRIRSRW